MASTTALVLSGPGVPDYSARGLKQSLSPIDMLTGDDMIWRTVNGELVSTVPVQMLKYKSEISGSDVDPPAVDGVWPGQTVTVDCVVWLATAGVPERDVVEARAEGGFTFYRPRLAMMVKGDINIQCDEYGSMTSWSLSLEEV